MAGDVIHVHFWFQETFIKDYAVLFEKLSFFVTICIHRGVKAKGMCGSCCVTAFSSSRLAAAQV